jgi:peptidylprolyl isomerase
MQTAQPGDRVRVHYVKRFQDGSVASSKSRGPVELTVGVDHRRLPGLGSALVGLAPGESTTISVPASLAYGLPNPVRVHRLARTRFPKDQTLAAGRWVRIMDRQGRTRPVRILEVHDRMVVVDANHRWAGQAMQLEVELIGIQAGDRGRDVRHS